MSLMNSLRGAFDRYFDTPKTDEDVNKFTTLPKESLLTRGFEKLKDIFGLRRNINSRVGAVLEDKFTTSTPQPTETKAHELEQQANDLLNGLLFQDFKWEDALSKYPSETVDYFLRNHAINYAVQLYKTARSYDQPDTALIQMLSSLESDHSDIEKRQVARQIYEDLVQGRITWSVAQFKYDQVYIDTFRNVHAKFFSDELLRQAFLKKDHAYLQEFAPVEAIVDLNKDLDSIRGYCLLHNLDLPDYLANNFNQIRLKVLSKFYNEALTPELSSLYSKLKVHNSSQVNKMYRTMMFYAPSRILDLAASGVVEFWPKILGDAAPETLEDWLNHAHDEQIKSYLSYLLTEDQLELMCTLSERTQYYATRFGIIEANAA